MNKYNFNLTFLESTTINDTQIDHNWTNAPIQQYHYRLAQAYWTYHKPIYFAFKLFDYVPQFVLPHNTTKWLGKLLKWNVLEKQLEDHTKNVRETFANLELEFVQFKLVVQVLWQIDFT
jgi:hypothetical protein